MEEDNYNQYPIMCLKEICRHTIKLFAMLSRRLKPTPNHQASLSPPVILPAEALSCEQMHAFSVSSLLAIFNTNL